MYQGTDAPTVERLEEIKRDAIKATFRRFQHEQEDGLFDPKINLDRVKKSMLDEMDSEKEAKASAGVQK